MSMRRKPVLKVLFCDDNAQFAASLVETLCRKLKTGDGITPSSVAIEGITHLKSLQDLIADPVALSRYDLVFCDLGWSDLTLNGIQLLHDIQMAHPAVYSVLYTAQDEDQVISQALRWQLDFIDAVIRIDGRDYFGQMMEVIRSRFRAKVLEAVVSSGVDGLDKKLEALLASRLSEVFLKEYDAITVSGHSFFDLFPECGQLISYKGQLPPRPMEKIRRRIREWADLISSGALAGLKSLIGDQYLDRLVLNLEQFPRLNDADLLPLKKSSYIEFVKKKYGGFPQMARDRGLDLNNIYRVNRRFKGASFVVFQLDTIREMIDVYDKEESNRVIAELLVANGSIKIPSG